MDDQIEQFVKKNRSHFDDDEPSPEVWDRIERRVGRQYGISFWWKVAAVCFLSSTIYFALDRNSEPPIHTAEVITEFAQAEAYYTQIISMKKAEIASFERDQLEEVFLNEIDKLDQMYLDLKDTYDRQNSTELVIDAMISNLQLRMEILNQQLKVLKQLKEAHDETESTAQI